MQLYSFELGAMGNNCYIIAEQASCVVVDPAAEPSRLLAFLKEKGLTVEAILLTHGHYDHTGAVKPLAKRFGCDIYMGEGDQPMLENPAQSLASFRGFPTDDYPLGVARVVKNGEIISASGMSFTAIETPGHTAGGMTYRCGDWLFTGDTLFYGSIGRTDLPGGNHTTMMRSLERLATLDETLEVLPGHGPKTTLKREKEHNPFMRIGSDDDFY